MLQIDFSILKGDQLRSNMVLRWATLCLLLLIVIPSFAQTKHTISGYVKDNANGENMMAVNVYLKENLKGTTTNEYGFFSLTVPEGEYTLIISYLGYQQQEIPVKLDQDLRINVDLSMNEILREEVVITGERKDKNVESTDMGKVELSTQQVKALPALLGEVDIMKTIQLLPGVMSAGEGNSGFYVRGGGPDQNLVLLDHAVVYNPGHLFGFFSVFNADAIKNTTLIKGGMPANYGGRLSSVVDIQMKEGNMKEFQYEGGIGLISSRLTIQGPFKKDKASFIVSARRTYIDLITKPIFKRVADGDLAGNTYYFYDINGKINYKFSDKDRLYLSGYFGRDVFKFESPDDAFDANIPWGNSTATLRWNHLFSDKMFMNAIAIYNDYRFEVTSGFQDFSFSLFSAVRDFSLQLDFDYFPAPNHSIKYGGVYTHHTFTPYNASGNAGDVEFATDSLNKKYAHEAAIYVLDDWTISSRVKVNFGVRGSVFSHVGPLLKYEFNQETGAATDTIRYQRGENIAFHWGIEPRVNIRIKLDEESSIKAGITTNYQYIHLVSSSTTTLPTDLWVPSTNLVDPQLGIQYSIGYFRNFKDNMFETSVEVYYKDLRNQIEFGESFVPELNADIEDSFVFGRGRSYGAEFFFKKAIGKLNGWVGYTLSWTNRKFRDLNNNSRFPAKYDRRHDLSIVAAYDINKKWKVGAVFVYGTGQATTVPIGRYFIEGQVVNQYGDRNDFRLNSYHRMDISATYVMKSKERGDKRYSDLTMSIYNLYNRQNPYFIFYDIDGSVGQGDLEVNAKQASLFPILPSITWNFKF